MVSPRDNPVVCNNSPIIKTATIRFFIAFHILLYIVPPLGGTQRISSSCESYMTPSR